MLHIITIPHQTLRATAKPIIDLNKKTVKFISKLETTLKNKSNPKGVGLAAPQVNTSWRAFVTQVADDSTQKKELSEIETFINPEIMTHSDATTLGPKKNEILEGCLSMPKYYGHVPRWEWVELEFDTLDQNGDSPKLVRQKKKFSGDKARVIQHELDHLDGILFTDYSLKYDLPVYIEIGSSLEEIEDRSVLESF